MRLNHNFKVCIGIDYTNSSSIYISKICVDIFPDIFDPDFLTSAFEEGVFRYFFMKSKEPGRRIDFLAAVADLALAMKIIYGQK
jgi:hypothetical protein